MVYAHDSVLTQFLDSAQFLSHCLDTVYDKKISIIFFLNKIKSNKMRQNFGKMKFSKIIFLWIKMVLHVELVVSYCI